MNNNDKGSVSLQEHVAAVRLAIEREFADGTGINWPWQCIDCEKQFPRTDPEAFLKHLEKEGHYTEHGISTWDGGHPLPSDKK